MIQVRTTFGDGESSVARFACLQEAHDSASFDIECIKRSLQTAGAEIDVEFETDEFGNQRVILLSSDFMEVVTYEIGYGRDICTTVH